MGVYIGDVYIPFVSNFTVDKSAKPTEQIKHLGNVPAHIAEFQADVLSTAMSGTLFKAAGDVRTVDQYAEDITALVERFGVYNYLNSYQGRSGWMVLESGDTDKSAESVLIRDYAMSGKFMPKNKYQARMHTAPVILANDFSLTLGAGGCDNYVPLPIGATYSGGDGSAITRVGADGTQSLVLATTSNDVKWDLAANEVDVGECKCWDDMNEAAEADWVRVFNPDHEFTGECVVENGLIRLEQAMGTNGLIPYFYDTVAAAWEKIADYIKPTYPPVYTEASYRIGAIKEITSDKIIIERPTFTSLYEDILRIEIYRGDAMVLVYTTQGNSDNMFFNDIAIYDARFYSRNGIDIYDIVMLSGIAASTPSAFCFSFGQVDTIYVAACVGATTFDHANMGFNSLTVGEKTFFGGFKAAYVPNLFKECEAMTQGTGVAFYTGADASPKTGNTGSILDAQAEMVYYNFTGGTDLPLGTYKLFVRAKDSAQVADDLGVNVTNMTDATELITPATQTLTAAWAYYSFDITIASDDDTDTIRVKLNKKTATANIIDLDYVLWVPITLESGNGPQDIAHQAMVNSRLKRELVAR